MDTKGFRLGNLRLSSQKAPAEVSMRQPMISSNFHSFGVGTRQSHSIPEVDETEEHCDFQCGDMHVHPENQPPDTCIVSEIMKLGLTALKEQKELNGSKGEVTIKIRTQPSTKSNDSLKRVPSADKIVGDESDSYQNPGRRGSMGFDENYSSFQNSGRRGSVGFDENFALETDRYLKRRSSSSDLIELRSFGKKEGKTSKGHSRGPSYDLSLENKAQNQFPNEHVQSLTKSLSMSDIRKQLSSSESQKLDNDIEDQMIFADTKDKFYVPKKSMFSLEVVKDIVKRKDVVIVTGMDENLFKTKDDVEISHLDKKRISTQKFHENIKETEKGFEEKRLVKHHETGINDSEIVQYKTTERQIKESKQNNSKTLQPGQNESKSPKSDQSKMQEDEKGKIKFSNSQNIQGNIEGSKDASGSAMKKSMDWVVGHKVRQNKRERHMLTPNF